MKLSYRGVSYEYTPPTVEIAEDEIVGTYRGLDWRGCNLVKPPVQQATVDLMYRGVAFTTGSEPAPVLSVPDKARHRMMDRLRSTYNRQRSLLSRAAAEVRLAV